MAACICRAWHMRFAWSTNLVKEWTLQALLWTLAAESHQHVFLLALWSRLQSTGVLISNQMPRKAGLRACLGFWRCTLQVFLLDLNQA